jgi:multiple sugar transport system permease protein
MATSSKKNGRRIKRSGEAAYGWAFVSPMIVILGVFLFVPIIMALWVSVSNWMGNGSPFSSSVSFVGVQNYSAVLAQPGLAHLNFGTAIRNNLWYTIFVIPLQTILSLVLAVLVNGKILKARGFFRTAFYFPSVTSSVAITVVWLFLFGSTGSINTIISWFGGKGPTWFNDPRGLIQIVFSWFGSDGPAALKGSGFLGITWWDWIAGPSVAMFAYILMAIFTTSGTFMLMFIAALQAIGSETEEAAIMDGATVWQRFWKITVPQLKPTIFTVITLGIIGTWQVFDQIYTGSKGAPANTTLTPAYLSYTAAFKNQKWGQGAAISFILFVIIILFTVVQRLVMRDKGLSRKQKRYYAKMKEETRASGSGPGVEGMKRAQGMKRGKSTNGAKEVAR